MTEAQHKMLPQPDADSRFYWEAGREGQLQILQCGTCQFHIHPPGPICPRCHSEDLAPHAVSGRGTVYSFSVNIQRWFPDMEVPYILASIELEEQAGLRVTSHLVGVEPRQARIGMAVEVGFRQEEDVWLPIFHPTGG